MTNGTIGTGEPVELEPSQAALVSLEQEIINDPKMLDTSISTILSRYEYTKTTEGFIITPDTVVELGNEENSESLTVFAGYSERDYHRKIIFKRDQDSGEAAEWIVFDDFPLPDAGIFDGNDQRLESDEEIKYVRSVLGAMKQSYARDVTETADNFDLKAFLGETLDDQIASKAAELEALKRQKDQLAEHGDEPINEFRVNIKSGWSKEGEDDLEEVVAAPSLSEALRLGADKFMEINHRSDIQANDYSVGVSVGEGQYWTVPKEVIQPLYRSLARWDDEAHSIDRAKQDLKYLKSKS